MKIPEKYYKNQPAKEVPGLNAKLRRKYIDVD
jgi:hypothetical protein